MLINIIIRIDMHHHGHMHEYGNIFGMQSIMNQYYWYGITTIW